MNADLAIRSDAISLSAPSKSREIEDSIAKACGRIAPLWPLKHFVAVNPFLGFAEKPFCREPFWRENAS
jgi:hypothetical protein